MLFWLGFALLIAIAGIAICWRLSYRRKRLISLNWPTTRSHFEFVGMCREYLIYSGWELEVEPDAGFDLKMKMPGMAIVLLCRSSGWNLGVDYIDRAGSMERQARTPIVIVMEEIPSDIDHGRADLSEVQLIHYSDLPSLQEIAVSRMKRLEW